MSSMLSPSCWPPLSGRLPGPRDVPLPEVALAPLTDPQHQRLAARRVLPGHHAQPRCELAPVLDGSPSFSRGESGWLTWSPRRFHPMEEPWVPTLLQRHIAGSTGCHRERGLSRWLEIEVGMGRGGAIA
jgi:hypothetical protein